MTVKTPKSKLQNITLYSSQSSKRGIQSRQAPAASHQNGKDSLPDEVAFMARDKIPRTPYKKE
jgi:hypothetical protein